MKSKLVNVQHLRGIAAMLVVISHVNAVPVSYGLAYPSSRYFATGGFGVDIFFVISGFIMYWTAGTKFGQPGASKRFLIKRIQRIVPIYWIFTAVEVATTVVSKLDEPEKLAG